FDNNPVIIMHLPKPGVAASVEMTPLTPERVFMPVGADQAALDYTSTGGVSVDSEVATAIGGKSGALTEAALQTTKNYEIATHYRDQEGGHVLADKVGYHEYDPEDHVSYTDPKLAPLSQAAAVVEEERLVRTRQERSRQVIPILENKVREFSTRITAAKNFAVILENIRITGRVERADFAAITTLLNVAREAQNLLETHDGDLDYGQIDQALNDNKVGVFLSSLDVAPVKAELTRVLTDDYTQQMTRISAEAEVISSRPDTERTPSQRLSDLKQKLAELTETQRNFRNIAATLDFPYDQMLDGREYVLKDKFIRFISPLEIHMRFEGNSALRDAFIGKLQEAGLLDKTNPYLGESAYISRLNRLTTDLASYPNNEITLQRLGLLNTTRPKFTAKQRARVAQIVDDLLGQDPEYLREGLVIVADPVPAASKAPTPAVVVPAPTPKLPDVSKPATAADQDLDADPDGGADMGEDFGL
ncbi:MAG: hypothetical protein ACD_21C00180G0001, partial [uncultured bacterium]